MTGVQSIKIAVTALGGQGGGVLAGWIGKLGEENGYIAQSTSVPGVAQRTGATIYYVELFPQKAARAAGTAPVLALTPVPGDVDIVIAAELMEAGRALVRGYVTSKTTLITSLHRDYAISEKSDMGDGRQDDISIIDAAKAHAGTFIAADMAGAAAEAGTVISAVLFGALAGAGALPFEQSRFEAEIKRMGRSIESNLRGFALGFEMAAGQKTKVGHGKAVPAAESDVSPAAKLLVDRMLNEFPGATHFFIKEGLKRTVDFQDTQYASTYLDRLSDILAVDRANGGEKTDWRLTQFVAKHLALWMSYEDSIRVADLKTRAARFDRFRDDVHAEDGQTVNVFEYLHPRAEEVCDILPVEIAAKILGHPRLKNAIGVMLGNGKRIPTTKIRGFLPLYVLSSLRFLRRSSYRFRQEDQRITAWLNTITSETVRDYALGVELAQLQRLIKGYGDTHERGLNNYQRIIELLPLIKEQDSPSGVLRDLRDAALTDEEGNALRMALQKLTNKIVHAA